MAALKPSKDDLDEDAVFVTGSPVTGKREQMKKAREKERLEGENRRRMKIKEKFERRLDDEKACKRHAIGGLMFLPEQYTNPEIAFSWIQFLAEGNHNNGWEHVSVRH